MTPGPEEPPVTPDPEEPPVTPPDNGGGNGGSSGGGGSDSSHGPGVTPGTVEIQTDPVPLSALPDLPSEEALTQIDDEEVPLAGLPKTGEAASPAKMMLLLSGMLLCMYGAMFKREEEEQ